MPSLKKPMKSKLITIFLLLVASVEVVNTAELNEACSQDSDCTRNKSYCKGGTCQCIDSIADYHFQTVNAGSTRHCAQVSYVCGTQKEGAFVRVMYKPAEPDKDIFGYFAIYEPYTNANECKTDSPTSDVTKTGVKYQLHLNASGSNANCGLQVVNERIAFTIVISHGGVIITGYDHLIAINCSTSMTHTISTSLGVVRAFPKLDPDNIDEVLSLVLISNEEPSEELSMCRLKQQVRMQITGYESLTAKGFQVLNCVARPTLNSEQKLALIEDRCGVQLLPEKKGFTQVGGVSTTGQITVKSEVFRCFSFQGASSIVIACDVAFCTEPEKDWCVKDHCVNKPTTKRRDVSSSRSHVTTVVFQYMVGDRSVSKPNSRLCQGTSTIKNGSCIVSENSCWRNIEVLGCVGGLLLALLLTVIATTFMWFRYKTLKHKVKQQDVTLSTKA